MTERICVNPDVRFGKPCVAGTRITVQNVLEFVNEGLSFDEIRADCYPQLSDDDLRACMAFAATDDCHER